VTTPPKGAVMVRYASSSRNNFELTNVYGTPTAGVMKDVVLVKGFRTIEVDATPAMEGLTLFHCHQQLHMDYGFMLLFNAV
jgi:FtsP/CotA-like multicopper oxidase with cupredoxin domain